MAPKVREKEPMTPDEDREDLEPLPPDIFEIEVIANKPIPEMFDRELARSG